MRIIEKIDNYLVDKEYKIIIKKNQINIINYDEIINFNLEKISVRHKDIIITIIGKNLYITKMIEDEVLIKGNITNVNIN